MRNVSYSNFNIIRINKMLKSKINNKRNFIQVLFYKHNDYFMHRSVSRNKQIPNYKLTRNPYIHYILYV